jgi:hypothetical protein
MPFYGANTGPLPPQPGGMVDPGSGFVTPLRDRFPNSVWHPASGADPNNVGGYTNCRLGTVTVPDRKPCDTRSTVVLGAGICPRR